MSWYYVIRSKLESERERERERERVKLNRVGHCALHVTRDSCVFYEYFKNILT